MRLQFKVGKPTWPEADTATFIFEDQVDLKKQSELGPLADLIAPLLNSGQFKASYLAELPLKTEFGWLLLVGLGKINRLNPAKIIEAAATVVKMALARKIRSLDLLQSLPEIKAWPNAIELAGLGGQISLYRQTEHKSKSEPESNLERLRFWGNSTSGTARLKRAEIIAEAVCLTRRLGDQPSNDLYPETFAQKAAYLAKNLGLKVQILHKKDLAREKLNLILAVGAGSIHPPRLVTIQYNGAMAKRPPLALVGKGVTFDSGGISLKPAINLDGMKTDMAGAATILAVILAAAQLNLPLNLRAILPLAENLPSGSASRVGDVYTSRSGQTVEITNTDAEGRLILAEALTWAGEMTPEAIIDVATLTGACAVALGDNCAGLFSNDKKLQTSLLNAAESTGENLWPLPLLEEYEENLKSNTADLVNAPRATNGGAINAALFLQKFIPPLCAWAHLDIAGPGRADKARPSTPVGTSGFAVRTLLYYLLNKT